MKDDSVSISSNEQYNIAPFEDEAQIRRCECNSCQWGEDHKQLTRKLFFLGFIIPVSWLANIILYSYTQFFLNHEVTSSKLEDNELPTLFMKTQAVERSRVELKTSTIRERDQIYLKGTANPESESESELPIKNPFMVKNENTLVNIDSNDELFEYRFQFLKEYAQEIVEYHDELRKSHRTWTLRTCVCVVIYGIIIILVYIIVVSSSPK